MRTVSLLFFLICQIYAFAQIQFTIEPQADNRTYLVKLKPDQSFSGPKNLTNSAQISLVVPTGGFVVGNLQNFKGKWQNNNNIVAPESNPQKDYLVFNLLGHIKDIEYEEGEEVTLFSFENVGKPTGKPRFVSRKDIALFKNRKLNIGNQISVLGAGFKNAFSGTYSKNRPDGGLEVAVQGTIDGNLIPSFFDLSLNVKREGIALNWQINENKRMTKMVVEKSVDGQNFQAIEVINNATDSHQLFIDVNPDFGPNHYRVRQHYEDNEYQYSNIQTEFYKIDKASVNIYPNPVSDNLNLRIGHFADLEGQVRIFSMSGIEMASKPLQKDQKQLQIATQDYTNGIYFLIIETNNRKILERQFIVEQGQ